MTRATAHKPRNSRVFAPERNGWYVEPRDCTAALLSVEGFDGVVYDPACGQGHVVETLIAHGVPAIGTDLVRRVPPDLGWWRGHRDFTRPDRLRLAVDHVVMNPPFGGGVMAEAFIRRALDTVPGGKVAVFLPIRFMTSRKRVEGLYADRPPHRAWVLAPRPSCPTGQYLSEGHKPGGGNADFLWMVWDGALAPARPGETRLGWAMRPGAAREEPAPADDQAEAA